MLNTASKRLIKQVLLGTKTTIIALRDDTDRIKSRFYLPTEGIEPKQRGSFGHNYTSGYTEINKVKNFAN